MMRPLQPTWRLRALFTFCLLLAGARVGQAQAIRMPARLQPVKTNLICLTCTLTVSASPATVSFTLVAGGVAAGNASVSIVTRLTGTASVIGTLNLYGYFSSSTAALTGQASSADVLPSSAVLGRCTTGLPTTFTAFTQTGPWGAANAGLEIYSQSLAVATLPPITRTDTLSLEINLAGLTNVAADTYSGLLMLQAEQF